MQADRSAGDRPSHACILRAISIRFSWVTGTRLADPVVPEVRKMAATDFASVGTMGCGCVTGRTSVNTTSSNEDDAWLTVNNPKFLPGPWAQAGTRVQPGTIRALRRSLSSSACRSPGARLGL